MAQQIPKYILPEGNYYSYEQAVNHIGMALFASDWDNREYGLRHPFVFENATEFTAKDLAEVCLRQLEATEKIVVQRYQTNLMLNCT